MSEEIASEFLTKGEEKLLNAMIGVDSVKHAAQKIGIKPHTAYNILYRMRKSYRFSRGRVNTIDAQKKRGRLFKLVLSGRMTEG